MSRDVKTGLKRRAVLGGIASLVANAAAGEAVTRSLRPVARPVADLKPSSAQGELSSLIEAAGLTGTVGAALMDAETGALIEGYNASSRLPPASVAKAITAQFALETLGPDYRFTTRLLATGGVQDGAIQGDLILVGGGDPVLTTDDLAEAARRLKEAGIREVKGQFLVWDGALPYQAQIDAEQMAHLGYNPAMSGLNLNFNRVHFEWARENGDYKVTMDARSPHFRPDVSVSRMRIETRDWPVYTFANGEGYDEWTVARGALGQGGARWLPVRRPALYAGDVFRTFARSNGIVLKVAQKAGDLPDGDELVRLSSPSLSEIVSDMLKYSVNLTAEVLGLTASATRNSHIRTLTQSGREMGQWLLREHALVAQLVDHSGLGDDSRVSARTMASFMASSSASTMLRPLLKPVPIRGTDGRAIPNHPVEVVAKTGTLNFVSTLSGFVRTANGEDRSFAIFAADLDKRELAKRSQDEVPRGARSWARKARNLQQELLKRWGAL